MFIGVFFTAVTIGVSTDVVRAGRFIMRYFYGGRYFTVQDMFDSLQQVLMKMKPVGDALEEIGVLAVAVPFVDCQAELDIGRVASALAGLQFEVCGYPSGCYDCSLALKIEGQGS